MTFRSVSILVHGQTKAGKSTLASTSPKPLLYLDIEGGTRFLNLNAIYWEPLTQPPPICDGSWDTAVVIVERFEEVTHAYQILNSGNHCFRSVAIDSITALQTLFLEEHTNRSQATRDDWGEVYRKFMGMIRDYHHLTMHKINYLSSVVFCSTSKESQSDGKSKPFVQGQSKDVLPYTPDIIGVMEKLQYTDPEDPTKKIIYHQFNTGYHPLYETGSRVEGRLPEQLVNEYCNIPLILDYIYGIENPPPNTDDLTTSTEEQQPEPEPEPEQQPEPAEAGN